MQYTLNIRYYYGNNMVRFVRTLQHRVTKQGRDFYALSIPPQVAEALGLKAGGQVSIDVNPIKKGKFEVVLKPISTDDNLNP
jgi:bifunctional DNA-binding transcriptional regulator/antitoxin component of YhaV-PrlF toxin-antitoxin module